MRKLFFYLFCICALITTFPFNSYSVTTGVAEEELRLYIGQFQTIQINSPQRIAIGNPAIADVAQVSKTQLTINPKSAGSTTLVVWDNFGEQAYRLNVFIEDTSLIKKRIDDILASLNLPDVYTKAEDAENRVALLGSVKSIKDKDRVLLALGPLVSKTVDLIAIKEEEAVIEIDVQVIELNRGSQDQLGFTWPGSIDLTEVASQALVTPGVRPLSLGKLFTVAGMTRDAFTLRLDMLVQEGKARVLSRPRLSCQSGKEAKLLVGGEVPVLSGTSTPSSTTPGSVGATSGASVEYKEYGVIMNIKPRLDESGKIHLNLDVTVSEVGDVVSTSYALAYTFTKRNATTELFLNDGQTMALGGLIKKKTSEDLTKMPWLADVPILGLFFRQRTTRKGWTSDTDKIHDTELFITLTPHLAAKDEKTQSALNLPQPKANIPSIGDDKIKDPVLKYSKLVQKRILENLVYPAEAKNAGFQGAVKLSLKLSPQGDILDAQVKEPSSYRILDDAALATAQATSPYPPFPPEIKEKEVWVDIPIVYQLE